MCCLLCRVYWNRMWLLVFVATISLFFVSAHSLSCLPCNETACNNVTCEGTVVKEACGCCPACSKQRGDVCGGPWNISGICDPKKNMTCSKFVGPRDLAFNLQGTCQPSIFEGRCSYPYVFSECASACQPDCEEPNPIICTLQCIVDECVCGQGFVRRSKTNRTCIPAEACPSPPQPECEFPKIFTECATACPPTCGNPYPYRCTKQCVLDPCICTSGYMMRSLTDKRCIRRYECQDYSFCEKTCPPLDFSATSCQLRKSWSCWLDVWKCNSYKWRMEMEKWWKGSCSSGSGDIDNLWGDLPSCADRVEVKCVNPDETMCALDAFGCGLCQCADGKYENPMHLLEIWKSSNNMSMAFNKVYSRARATCVSAGEEC